MSDDIDWKRAFELVRQQRNDLAIRMLDLQVDLELAKLPETIEPKGDSDAGSDGS